MQQIHESLIANASFPKTASLTATEPSETINSDMPLSSLRNISLAEPERVDKLDLRGVTEPLAFCVLQKMETFPDARVAAEVLQCPQKSWKETLADSEYFKTATDDELVALKHDKTVWKRHLGDLTSPNVLKCMDADEFKLIEQYVLNLDPYLVMQTLLQKLGEKHLHSSTISAVSKLLKLLVRENPLDTMLDRGEAWAAMLFSIPSKLANVLHSGPRDWFDEDVFYKKRAEEVVKLAKSNADISLLTKLVSKLVRLNRSSLILPHLQNADISTWKNIIPELSSAELDKFVDAFVTTLPSDTTWFTPLLTSRLVQTLLNKHLLASPLSRDRAAPVCQMVLRDKSVDEGWEVLEKVADWVIEGVNIGGPSHARHCFILLYMLSLLQPSLDVSFGDKLDSLLARIVTPHLRSVSSAVHTRGLVLAEEVSRVTSAVRGGECVTFDLESVEGEELRGIVLGGMEKREKDGEKKEPQQREVMRVEHVHEPDLPPYALSESEAESEAEEADPKSHAKLRAPTYIIDLISYLSSHDDVEKQRVGLSAAMTLLPNMSSGEVRDHGALLVSLFLRLHNDFDLPKFDSVQKDALRALLDLGVKNGVDSVPRAFIDAVYERNRTLSMRLTVLEVVIMYLAADPITQRARTPADLGRVAANRESVDEVVKRVEARTRRFQSAPPPTTKSDPLASFGMAEKVVTTLIGRIGYTGNSWDVLRELTRAGGDVDSAVLVLVMLVKAGSVGVYRCRNLPAIEAMATVMWQLCCEMRFMSISQVANEANGVLRSVLVGMAVVLGLADVVVGNVVGVECVDGVSEWMWSVVQDGSVELKELAMEVLHGLKKVTG